MEGRAFMYISLVLVVNTLCFLAHLVSGETVLDNGGGGNDTYNVTYEDTILIGYVAESDTDPGILAAIDAVLTLEENHFEVVRLHNGFKHGFDDIVSVYQMMTSSNISAVIGPYNQPIAIVAEQLHLPYMVTSRVPLEADAPSVVAQIYPGLSIFEQAVLDLVTYFEWDRIGVFYDKEEGAFIFEKLMLMQMLDIQAYNLINVTHGEIRNFLKTARAKGFIKFIMVCTASATPDLLEQALYLSMMSSNYQWLVVNLEMEDLDFSVIMDTLANLTGLMLPRNTQNNSTMCPSGYAEAFAYDSVSVLNRLFKQKNGSQVSSTSLTGLRLDLEKISLNGCTGKLTFGADGKRKSHTLQLFTMSGLKNGSVGTWLGGPQPIKQRIDFTYRSQPRDIDNPFGQRIIRIVTKIEEPFVQFKNGVEKPPRGYDVEEFLEGFCLDILRELSHMLNFKYTIYLVPDGKFGSLKSYGWTGMVKELVHGNADIALAPFSMTPTRSAVVDFTKPYMIKGTTTVIRKPDRHVSFFQFLGPLSDVVWIGIFVAYLATSSVLFGVSRASSDRLEKYTHNLLESFWYMWTTLLRGSASHVPQASSGRILISTWWFFSLIIISIYTANLAAFLTITSVNVPMNSAADLANQNEFDYGTVEGSQIEMFFKHTKISSYAKMWADMSTLSPASMVRRVENGLQRVRETKYAFLWDSPTLRYLTQEDCDLMEVGTPFDLKGYGMALTKHAPFSESLSWAILKLNDDDMLRKYEKKWWGKAGCPDTTEQARTEALEVVNLLGIFVVLGCGLVLAVAISLCQYLIRSRLSRRKVKMNANSIVVFY